MTTVDNDNSGTLITNWQNDAINVWDSTSNVRKFLEALLTELDRYDGDAEKVLQARHIDTATGDNLDKIGEIGDINRKTGENDDKYRARIKAKLVSGNSSATIEDVINFTASILQIDPETVGVDTDFPDRPIATVTGIPSSAFNNTKLTELEVIEILSTLVPAGHTMILRINQASFALKAVAGSPSNPVTAQELKDDGFKGLSDNNFDGGRLIGLIVP